MRNRAKCALCGDILESFTLDDWEVCSCKEIAIGGGSTRFLSKSRDERYSHFLRVDDLGAEKPVKYEDGQTACRDDDHPKDQEQSAPIYNMIESIVKALDLASNPPEHKDASAIIHNYYFTLQTYLINDIKEIIRQFLRRQC